VTTGNSSQPASQGNTQPNANNAPPKEAHSGSEPKGTQTLDYQFYHRACELAGEAASEETFTEGQRQGKFKFTQDATLLNSLLTLYNLNLHQIAGEWTVFANKPGQVTVFAATPLDAVLTWVITQPLALLTG